MCLLALGIAILLLTLAMGYGLYSAVTQTSTNATTQNQSAASSTVTTMNGITGAVTSAIASQVAPLAVYARDTMEVMVFALFASIGYKISKLGIQLVIGSGKDAGK
jgi:ABC-type Zn uptake system ZnuABC Zn-binding protein ZnuA